MEITASEPPASTYAVIKTIDVGSLPLAVAVNSLDDSVYVTHYIDNLYVVDGSIGVVDDSIPSGLVPLGIAVDQDDDTVYVTDAFSGLLSIINGRTFTRDDTMQIGSNLTVSYGVAVNSADDTVYVANSSSNAVVVFNGANIDDTSLVTVDDSPALIAVNQIDDTIYVTSHSESRVSFINATTNTRFATAPVGGLSLGLAVDDADDTVYVVNDDSDTLAVINGHTGDLVRTVPVAQDAYGVAVHQDSATVFVSSGQSSTLTIIDGRGTDDSVALALGGTPAGVAVDQDDALAYVANLSAGSLQVIAIASPALQTATGLVGSTATVSVSVESLPESYLFDDATIGGVSFGGVPGSNVSRNAGTNTWSVTVPPGSGSVPVTVNLQGGQSAAAGTFTYLSPPTFPPGPPTDVTGAAGDAEVMLSWDAPSSTGSFPISTYQVRSIPSGGACLTALTSCEITDLSNGTAYFFEVRALNGAGWGPWSAPSDPITPVAPVEPTIVISGTRGDVRGKPGVIVTGSSMDLGMGAILRPWIRFPGPQPYTQGTAEVLVDVSGGFTWERRTNKKLYVFMRTTDGELRSNRIIIRPL